jgi:hypothetical protein
MNFLPAVTGHARCIPVRNVRLEFRLNPVSPCTFQSAGQLGTPLPVVVSQVLLTFLRTLLRHLGPFLSGFGQPDRDRLFPALYLLSRSAALQRAGFALLHGAADLFCRSLRISALLGFLRHLAGPRCSTVCAGRAAVPASRGGFVVRPAPTGAARSSVFRPFFQPPGPAPSRDGGAGSGASCSPIPSFSDGRRPWRSARTTTPHPCDRSPGRCHSES